MYLFSRAAFFPTTSLFFFVPFLMEALLLRVVVDGEFDTVTAIAAAGAGNDAWGSTRIAEGEGISTGVAVSIVPLLRRKP